MPIDKSPKFMYDKRKETQKEAVMDIRSLCVCEHIAGGFDRVGVSTAPEEKSVPMLSVVQSLRGSYRVSLDGGTEFETGDMGVFIVPRQVLQRITHIPAADGTMDAQWVFLDVEINRLYKLDDLYDLPVILPEKYNGEVCDLITSIRASEDFLTRLPALHRLVTILLENATPKPHIPEDVTRLRSYVENHFMNPITPEDLSRVLHCSRSSLYRRFGKYFGVSPGQYVNSVRIRRACFLLTETDRSVGEIAASVGIPDVFYFARLFRAATGKTATEYRGKRR
jgi:AraC-like DNA-binding protein